MLFRSVSQSRYAGGYDGINIAIDKLIDKGKDVYIGVYDFGLSDNGKAKDLADVGKEEIDSISYIYIDDYIEQNTKDVDTLEKAGFTKSGTEVELKDGSTVLCIDKIKEGDRDDIPRITLADLSYIKRIDSLFNIKELFPIPF